MLTFIASAALRFALTYLGKAKDTQEDPRPAYEARR
jgi:hypothetical protein